MMTHRTHVPDDFLDAFLVGMGCIHSHHIHARLEKMTDEIHLTTTVTDTGYDFCLFHTIFP